MEISNYTAEDFVLDPSFKKWVLQPNAASNLYWEDLLVKNPSKYKEAKDARAIILRLNTKTQPKMSDREMSDLWKDIDSKMSEVVGLKASSKEIKVIPLNSLSTLERGGANPPSGFKFLDSFRFRVAGILLMAFSLGFMYSWFFSDAVIPEVDIPVVAMVEHRTVPGVKSHLTLSDGSQVILNSGSELKYVKDFEKDRREVYLKGEAFFNIAKDSNRHFIVISKDTKTTALGTSFNVRAYEGETLNISLLTGKVAVNREGVMKEAVFLDPGEALRIDMENDRFVKTDFDRDLVIGWTKKWIIFQKTPLIEAIRVLENWYGVKIQIARQPGDQVLLSGRFQDETLENVLEGLKFSARFDFAIDKENVKIIFKDEDQTAYDMIKTQE
ncbi:FecR family protein [Lunatibacter salilacus]|uniref:FecR family protein n=1 Tax=Lunatibacter salilacus TaxID=2483804 RepID=UPI00131C54BF|nr:FecR domain-containing protein [Lunatibacter salilacus]